MENRVERITIKFASMSEEILFKALREDGKGWIEGFYGIKGEGTNLEEHCIMASTLGAGSIDRFYFTDHEVIPETVCQFINKLDKKGKKIFKGDEITYTNTYEFDNFGDEKEYLKGFVSSHKGRLLPFFQIGGIDCEQPCDHSSVELTGKNIHDK